MDHGCSGSALAERIHAASLTVERGVGGGVSLVEAKIHLSARIPVGSAVRDGMALVAKSLSCPAVSREK
jgi:hypothetical protein